MKDNDTQYDEYMKKSSIGNDISKEEIIYGNDLQYHAIKDAGLYFAYSATLRIFGDIPCIEDITKKLNLIPTYQHKKGDLVVRK